VVGKPGFIGLASAIVIAAAASGCGALRFLEAQTGLACQQPPEAPAPADEVIEAFPDLRGKTPAQAAALLEDANEIEVSWRYWYLTEPGGNVGYSECWCVPPPDGVVSTAELAEGNLYIVFVDRDSPIPGGRRQPVQGWGC
jgi:hypothetical protein